MDAGDQDELDRGTLCIALAKLIRQLSEEAHEYDRMLGGQRLRDVEAAMKLLTMLDKREDGLIRRFVLPLDAASNMVQVEDE